MAIVLGVLAGWLERRSFQANNNNNINTKCYQAVAKGELRRFRPSVDPALE